MKLSHVCSELNQARSRAEKWNTEQSRSDRAVRELRAQVDDLTQALTAKDAQLAILRVRLDEADQLLRSRSSALEEAQSERTRYLATRENYASLAEFYILSKLIFRCPSFVSVWHSCLKMKTLYTVCDDRILQDHSEGNSLHSQALQTLQERLREAEVALNREQDSYRQIQVSNMLHMHNTSSSYSSNPVLIVYRVDKLIIYSLNKKGNVVWWTSEQSWDADVLSNLLHFVHFILERVYDAAGEGRGGATDISRVTDECRAQSDRGETESWGAPAAGQKCSSCSWLRQTRATGLQKQSLTYSPGLMSLITKSCPSFSMFRRTLVDRKYFEFLSLKCVPEYFALCS